MVRLLFPAVLLLGSTFALAAEPRKTDEHEKSSDKGEKMICKRFTETGSLVRARRVCKTKQDWEREREAIRSMTNSSGSCAGQGLSGGC